MKPLEEYHHLEKISIADYKRLTSPSPQAQAKRAYLDAQRHIASLPGVVLAQPITLLLPVRAKHSKSREAWQVTARRTKTQRQLAYQALRQASPYGQRYELPLRIALTRIAPRRLDTEDNLPLSLSAIRDGLTDALGLLTDEIPGRLMWEYGQEPPATPRTYAVRVVLSPHTETGV